MSQFFIYGLSLGHITQEELIHSCALGHFCRRCYMTFSSNVCLYIQHVHTSAYRLYSPDTNRLCRASFAEAVLLVLVLLLPMSNSAFFSASI